MTASLFEHYACDMVSILYQPYRIRIPVGRLKDLEGFRDWIRADTFPERGRIDWVGGVLEVDLSAEDLNTHGTPKAAIAGALQRLIAERGRGVVLIDRTRVTVAAADLCVEPDVVVVLFKSIEAGRVRLVPKVRGQEVRFIEIEGPPDIVVECVSDSSVKKDTKLLRERYHAAGVNEYWLSDARKADIAFEVLRHRPERYRRVRADADGFRRSRVLGRSVRLVRFPARLDVVIHKLETRPL